MGQRILVVDDDLGILETLEDILTFAGYEVVLASNGQMALVQLEKELPALIVLDIMMPKMDGYAFAAELQQRRLHPGIPILVLTADGRASQKAAQIGADAWLEKPFTMTNLTNAVERLLEP